MRYFQLLHRLPIGFLTLLVALPLHPASDALAASVVRPLAGNWGPISGPFGTYDTDYCGLHLADDVPRPAGTPVYSIADGKVVYAKNMKDIGHAVHIEHVLPTGETVTSVYYHLLQTTQGGRKLTEDQKVVAGEEIGTVTGNPQDYGTGPHLHFGVRSGSSRYDLDDRTHRWFYPGYTTIYILKDDCECVDIDECYKNKCFSVKQCDVMGSDPDEADQKHDYILHEWQNPTYFLAGLPDPTTPPDPSTEFSIGDSVEVTEADVNVRSEPNGMILGTQSPGTYGAVVDGPAWSSPYWWWKVDFQSGTDGWVAEQFLQGVGTATTICDVGNPKVPCEVNGITYDTFAGNYTNSRDFYKASSYEVSISGGYLILSLKTGLPHTDGYAYTANYGATIWTSPPPDNVNFGIFGQFNGASVGLANHFEWIGVGSANLPSTDFPIGATVEIGPEATALVWDAPDGNLAGYHDYEDRGTVVDGPRYSANYKTWVWNVNFEFDPDGWVAEEVLRKVEVVNGVCGSAIDTCLSGRLKNNPPYDTDQYQQWQCMGENGGEDSVICRYDMGVPQ